MREPLEIFTASLMQNMVQICKKQLFRDQIRFLKFLINCFWALGVESPHGGATGTPGAGDTESDCSTTERLSINT